MIDMLNEKFLKLRKRYIEQEFSFLNKEQREGVLKTEGPLLILAGAGSGKTTVLINRIANILKYGNASDSDEIPFVLTEGMVRELEEGINSGKTGERLDYLCRGRAPYPSSILAITFTNKAASELKERLCAKLGTMGDEIWAMTFHSACCRILRREIDRLGYENNFTIYDTADSERVMKDVIKDFNLDEKNFPARMFLNQISKAKDQLLEPEEYQKRNTFAGDFRLELVGKCYTEYQRRLKSSNALDFDDIIILTVRLLREYPEVLEYYSQKFRYILVDEYQDTNYAQYLLTSLLAKKHGNICVVGDDDQSIYKFRGATIENILQFEKQYPGAVVIRLEQNYRSTKAILSAANAVISHNYGRKGKKLWTENEKGSPVSVYEAMNEYAEADYVSDAIMKAAKEHGYRECAVLYRTNAQSNAMERSLTGNGIPYRIFGGTRFFERAEIKDMVAYLTLIDNHNDDLRLRRIVNNPPRGIGAKSFEQVERLSTGMELPLFEVMDTSETYPALVKASAKYTSFTKMIKYLSDCSAVMSLPDLYDEIISVTGYINMLREKDTTENQVRAENVMELKSNMIKFQQENENPTLRGFLEEISLYTDLEQYDANEDAAVLMTMHSAKGLEFANVWIIGAEEGIFPSSRCNEDPSELEEERRLCYVAITRAKKNLTMTHAKQRMLYGRTANNAPSRFIRELPDDEIKYLNRRVRTNTGSSFDDFFSQTASRGYSSQRSAKPQTSSYYSTAIKKSAEAPAKEAKPTVTYQPGNMVEHRSFGRGMVVTAVRMGNDTLLEIAFDNCGTKKLLANSAAAHMTKI